MVKIESMLKKLQNKLSKIETELSKCRGSVLQDGWQTQRFAKKQRKWDELAKEKFEILKQIENMKSNEITQSAHKMIDDIFIRFDIKLQETRIEIMKVEILKGLSKLEESELEACIKFTKIDKKSRDEKGDELYKFWHTHLVIVYEDLISKSKI